MLPPWLSIVAPKYGPDAAAPPKNKAEETAPIVEIAEKSYPILYALPIFDPSRMIPKSARRFSEKIMRKQEARAG